MATTATLTTRRFRAGVLDRQALFLEATLEPKKGKLCLSVSGSLYRGAEMISGGLNRDDLRELLERGTLAAGVDRATLEKLLDVWERWHLNDMHAECEHQRALGWTYNEHHDPKTHQGEACPTCGYKIGSAWLMETLPKEVAEFVRLLPHDGDADNPADLLPKGVSFTVKLMHAAPPLHPRGNCPKERTYMAPCLCTAPGAMDTWAASFALAKGAPHVFEYRTGMGHRKNGKPTEPKGGDVLACIASDALAYLNARNLDDFAAELGKDKPSEVQAAWEGCGRAARAMKALGIDPEDPWGVGAP